MMKLHLKKKIEHVKEFCRLYTTGLNRKEVERLLKKDALGILAIVRDRLAAIHELTEQAIENMLRSLADEKQVGLGKVAQPLRVALCGTTISLPIFDSVEMLGKEKVLARIENTLREFGTHATGEQT